jgi:hypothetical protein
MVIFDGNFPVGRGRRTDYPKIHIFQCTLERTDAIKSEVLEPITFVLAYRAVFPASDLKSGYDAIQFGGWTRVL